MSERGRALVRQNNPRQWTYCEICSEQRSESPCRQCQRNKTAMKIYSQLESCRKELKQYEDKHLLNVLNVKVICDSNKKLQQQLAQEKEQLANAQLELNSIAGILSGQEPCIGIKGNTAKISKLIQELVKAQAELKDNEIAGYIPYRSYQKQIEEYEQQLAQAKERLEIHSDDYLITDSLMEMSRELAKAKGLVEGAKVYVKKVHTGNCLSTDPTPCEHETWLADAEKVKE